MVILQELKNGQFIITVNKSVVKGNNLVAGTELVFMTVGSFVEAKTGDILIRPTGIVKE